MNDSRKRFWGHVGPDPCQPGTVRSRVGQVNESCERRGVRKTFFGPLPAGHRAQQGRAGEQVFLRFRVVATKTPSPAAQGGRGRGISGAFPASLKRLVHRPGKLAGVAASLAALLFILSGLLVRPTAAAETAATGKGQCFVLIVSGHPGNDLFARHYRDRIARFHKYFTQHAHVAAANITVLSGGAAFKDAMVTGPATSEKILAALAGLGKKVKPEDQFILVLLGHGATSEDGCTLMVPGPDIEVATMAEALNHIAARNQVVLNFASNSGDTIARLSRVGRAVVAASSPGQVNDSDFAEFFLQALETGAGDDGDEKLPAPSGRGAGGEGERDRPPSLLATYNWAVLHTAEWTVRQKAAPSTDPGQPQGQTPGWIVEGRQSAEIFKRLYSGPDVPPDRSFVPSPDSEQPDAKVESLVANNGEWWMYRRAITETPSLDDLGLGKAASALSVKGYQPLKGAAPTEVGFFARQIMLGSSQLLPAEVEKIRTGEKAKKDETSVKGKKDGKHATGRQDTKSK